MRLTCVVPWAANPASTSAAEARRSLAMTGAPLKGRPPLMMALGPSMEISAPSRASSLTCINRDSKMRSVIMLNPGVSAIRTIICAWASVGNPAYGMVVISTGFNCLAALTVRLNPLRSIFAPVSRSLSSTAWRWAARAPCIVIFPSVAAAAMANVAVSMRSGITSCLQPSNSFTPLIVVVGLPAPTICAPILFRKNARSTTSGSQAALSMVVTPWARTAAIMTFAVPSTVGPARPKKHIRPNQLRRLGVNVTTFDGDLRPQIAHAFQMQINRARPNHAAARQRNFRLMLTSQERPENADRAAHLADQIVIANGLQFARLDRNDVPIHLHLRPERHEDFRHELDIAQIRRPPDHTTLSGQQRRRHNRENGVFRAANGHLAVQRHTTSDQQTIHVRARVEILPGTSRSFGREFH